MNWDAISAIADVLGIIGLIGTLVYLAIQIRQNTASVKANTELETSRIWAEFHARVAHSSEMATIWDKALTDEKTLSPDEKRKFIWFVAEFFVMTESHFRQWKSNYLSDDTWKVYRGTASGLLTNPLVKRWWKSGVSPYSDEFMNNMNTAVTELGDTKWKYSPLSNL